MNEVSEIFGINIESPELFKHALTHPSYTKDCKRAYDENYERLEFLGDAVLKLVVSDILYRTYPDYAEGNLSKIRSIVVSDAILFEICEAIGLSKLIILPKHEEGYRKLESVCACAFEAILGAYYLDGKLLDLIDFIDKTFCPYIEDADKNFEKYNAKAILQEYMQKKMKMIPDYRLIAESGPAHNKTFETQVLLNGEVIGNGIGKSKKESEQHAAYDACKKLELLECQK